MLHDGVGHAVDRSAARGVAGRPPLERLPAYAGSAYARLRSGADDAAAAVRSYRRPVTDGRTDRLAATGGGRRSAAVPLLIVCLGRHRTAAGANQGHRAAGARRTCWSCVAALALLLRRRAPLAGWSRSPRLAIGGYLLPGYPYGPILFAGPVGGLRGG